jgi:hypothetical protein
MTNKIYNVALRAWGGRRRCGLKDGAGLTASWALDVAGSGRTTTLWTRGGHISSASWAQKRRRVHNVVGSGRTTLLQARERRRGLGDEAYIVDGATGPGQGRWQRVRASTVVGNDGAEAPGRTRRWHRLRGCH